jgi:hypothetical protein
MVVTACILVVFAVLNYAIQPRTRLSLGALASQLFFAGLLLYFAKIHRKY